MTLNLTIENIASKIVTGSGYSFEDPKQADDFKTIIHDICLKELEPLFQTLPQAVPVAPVAMPPTYVQQQAQMTKPRRNGYNLFCQEFRQKLGAANDEAAKAKFKELGGLAACGPEWKKLDEATKKAYNARAAAQRTTQQPVGVVTPGPVPLISTTAKPRNKWQRFQSAFSKELAAKEAAGETIPVFATIGERNKACSAVYQPISKTPEIYTYLALWGA